mmetsp:Transcript_63238/g.150830  ORF Transcript_63238/g.150830 Transcript_63238/m.150830 type:complete len:221 (-) Transcript_63238:86-748(-)
MASEAPSAPSVVVFDMGGVLGPDTDLRILFEDDSRKVDKEAVDKAWNASWNMGRVTDNCDMAAFWAPILEAAGLPGSDWEVVDGKVKQQFTAFWQILGVADRICRQGYRIGIISNHLSSWFDHWFVRYSLSDLFQEADLVLVSARAGVAKPDAAIYQQFCTKSGLKPSDCIFVDDKLKNVEVARDLGFHGIHFRHIAKDGSLKQTAEELVDKIRACGMAL